MAIILCIPPERMPEGEIREDTFTDLLMPYRGLPTGEKGVGVMRGDMQSLVRDVPEALFFVVT